MCFVKDYKVDYEIDYKIDFKMDGSLPAAERYWPQVCSAPHPLPQTRTIRWHWQTAALIDSCKAIGDVACGPILNSNLRPDLIFKI